MVDLLSNLFTFLIILSILRIFFVLMRKTNKTTRANLNFLSADLGLAYSLKRLSISPKDFSFFPKECFAGKYKSKDIKIEVDFPDEYYGITQTKIYVSHDGFVSKKISIRPTKNLKYVSDTLLTGRSIPGEKIGAEDFKNNFSISSLDMSFALELLDDDLQKKIIRIEPKYYPFVTSDSPAFIQIDERQIIARINYPEVGKDEIIAFIDFLCEVSNTLGTRFPNISRIS
ncbi:MAG: hypothetical protein V1875_03650 [Candidatus Altiarchaeota archaeon]